MKGGAGCAGDAKRSPPCRRRDTQARRVHTLVRLLAYQRLNVRPSSHARENTVGLLRKRLAHPTWTHLTTPPLRRSDCGCGHLLAEAIPQGPASFQLHPTSNPTTASVLGQAATQHPDFEERPIYPARLPHCPTEALSDVASTELASPNTRRVHPDDSSLTLISFSHMRIPAV